MRAAERLGAIDAAVAAFAARLDAYEQRHADALGRPHPPSDRAHALAPRPAKSLAWPADELDAELGAVEASLGEWLARLGAWSASMRPAEEESS